MGLITDEETVSPVPCLSFEPSLKGDRDVRVLRVILRLVPEVK